MNAEPHLESLKIKHADLDAKIAAEEGRPHPDDDVIHDLKKQKLRIKDALFSIQRHAGR
jgi:hypothetical protein